MFQKPVGIAAGVKLSRLFCALGSLCVRWEGTVAGLVTGLSPEELCCCCSASRGPSAAAALPPNSPSFQGRRRGTFKSVNNTQFIFFSLLTYDILGTRHVRAKPQALERRTGCPALASPGRAVDAHSAPHTASGGSQLPHGLYPAPGIRLAAVFGRAPERGFLTRLRSRAAPPGSALPGRRRSSPRPRGTGEARGLSLLRLWGGGHPAAAAVSCAGTGRRHPGTGDTSTGPAGCGRCRSERPAPPPPRVTWSGPRYPLSPPGPLT